MKKDVSGSPAAQYVGQRTKEVHVFSPQPASQHSIGGKHRPPRPQLHHGGESPQRGGIVMWLLSAGWSWEETLFVWSCWYCKLWRPTPDSPFCQFTCCIQKCSLHPTNQHNMKCAVKVREGAIFLNTGEPENCLGFFYLQYHSMKLIKRQEIPCTGQ